MKIHNETFLVIFKPGKKRPKAIFALGRRRLTGVVHNLYLRYISRYNSSRTSSNFGFFQLLCIVTVISFSSPLFSPSKRFFPWFAPDTHWGSNKIARFPLSVSKLYFSLQIRIAVGEEQKIKHWFSFNLRHLYWL